MPLYHFCPILSIIVINHNYCLIVFCYGEATKYSDSLKTQDDKKGDNKFIPST